MEKGEVSMMVLPPFSSAGAPATPSKSQKAKTVTGGMKNHTVEKEEQVPEGNVKVYKSMRCIHGPWGHQWMEWLSHYPFYLRNRDSLVKLTVGG